MAMQTIFPLVISDTDMTLLSTCELRWFRERCQNLKSAPSIDLIAGGHFARAMELVRKSFYVEKKSEEESIEIGYEWLVDSMQAEVENKFDDELKNPVRMGKVLQAYFRAFPLELEEVLPCELEDGSYSIEHSLSVELPILHPELGVPLIFKGKLDMLTTYLGKYYILDDKTTKQIKSNEGVLLQASGQFLGYAWLLREHGINAVGAKVRKCGIYKSDTKFQEFPIAITEFAIDNWYRAMEAKVRGMVIAYSTFKKEPNVDFRSCFLPDYKNGCTSFGRICPFVDGCVSKNGENFIESNFEQRVFDTVSRKEVSLEEYRASLGI